MLYNLLYTDIHILYFCRPLYSLSLVYTLIYTTQSRIFYTTLIYSFICLLLYSLLYTPLYTLYSLILLYTLIALLILPPPFYTSLLHLSSLSYILAPLIFILLYSYTVIPNLLYRKGITTLPPIFTHFTSLS